MRLLRKANAWGVAASILLWVLAGTLGWVSSVKFISHISLATMVWTFVAAWRADSDNPKEE